MSETNLIIGVVGTFASGKDTVAEFVAEYEGFAHVSSGDLVREYITEHKLGGLDRDNLRKVANELRLEKGAGYLVELAISRTSGSLVISGLRSPGEIEAVRDHKGIIIAVDAPVERRYQWAKERGRIDDAVTTKEFGNQEIAEDVNHKHHEQQLTAVITMADFDIANEGTLDDLHTQVNEVMKRILPHHQKGGQA